MKRISAFIFALTLIVNIFALSSIDVTAKTITKNGYYWTQHKQDEDYYDVKFNSPVEKKYTFKKNKLTIYGSLKRSKKKFYYKGILLKDSKRAFIISAKCKYYLNDGQGKREKYSKKKFKKYMKDSFPNAEHPYYVYDLRFRVKKGKIVLLELIQA